MAKATLIILTTSQIPVALLRDAIKILKADQLNDDEERESKHVTDELAKANMWLAIALAEEHSGKKLTKCITCNLILPVVMFCDLHLDETITSSIKYAKCGLDLWRTLADNLQPPTDDTKTAHNQTFFFDPAASIQLMSIH